MRVSRAGSARRERGQASAEAVALALVLGLLLAAVVAWVGSTRSADRLADAVIAALAPADPPPSEARPADLALVASALGNPGGARLRAVRFQLGERLGGSAADVVLDDAVERIALAAVPEATTGRDYGALSSPHGNPFAPASQTDLDRESPSGAPIVRRVTAEAAARAVGGELSHGLRIVPLLLSLAAVIPGERLARLLGSTNDLAHATHVAVEGLDRLSLASTTVSAAARLGDRSGIPPGLREDDILVAWPAERVFVRSGAVHASLCSHPPGRFASGPVALPARYVHLIVLRPDDSGLHPIAESLLVRSGRAEPHPCAA